MRPGRGRRQGGRRGFRHLNSTTAIFPSIQSGERGLASNLLGIREVYKQVLGPSHRPKYEQEVADKAEWQSGWSTCC